MKLSEMTDNSTVAEPVKNGTNLSDLLSEYGQPAEVSEPEKSNESDNSGTNKQISNDGNDTAESWQGNPAYYQTGKKAGQLRPLSSAPKMRIVRDNDPVEVDGELITGALFLTMIDLLFPLLISAIHNAVVGKKGTKIKADSLQLTSEQKKQLSPVADKVVKQLKMSANPTTILILTMCGLYGMQYAIARMEAKAKEK